MRSLSRLILPSILGLVLLAAACGGASAPATPTPAPPAEHAASPAPAAEPAPEAPTASPTEAHPEETAAAPAEEEAHHAGCPGGCADGFCAADARCQSEGRRGHCEHGHARCPHQA